MKTLTSQSGLFNPRILGAFALCSLGVLLAMLSLAATPTRGNAETLVPTMPLAPAVAGGDWSIVTSPNTSTTQNNLLGVTCVSASDCWAVGSYVADRGAPQTLIEHWDGTSWAIVPSPNTSLPNNVLSGVTCVSWSDCWAVGYYITGTA